MQMLQRSIIKFVFEGVDDFYVFGRLAGGGHAFFFAAFPGTLLLVSAASKDQYCLVKSICSLPLRFGHFLNFLIEK